MTFDSALTWQFRHYLQRSVGTGKMAAYEPAAPRGGDPPASGTNTTPRAFRPILIEFVSVCQVCSARSSPCVDRDWAKHPRRMGIGVGPFESRETPGPGHTARTSRAEQQVFPISSEIPIRSQPIKSNACCMGFIDKVE